MPGVRVWSAPARALNRANAVCVRAHPPAGRATTGARERQRLWAQGRVAATEAVQQAVWHFRGVPPARISVAIEPDAHGRPCCRLAGETASLAPWVSISHCDGASAALVAMPGTRLAGVGLDVARDDGRHEGLAEGGFGPEELRILDRVGEPARDAALLRLWCAKEAAAKAWGFGLLGDPLCLRVEAVERAMSGVHVTARGALALLVRARGLSASVRAVCGCEDGWVFAVAAAFQES